MPRQGRGAAGRHSSISTFYRGQPDMPKPLVIRHYAPYLGKRPKCGHALKVFHVLTPSEERVTCRACLRRLQEIRSRHNGNQPAPKPAINPEPVTLKG